MHTETLPGTGNVVRFPVERRARATMGWLRELAPDVREVSLTAETFGFAPLLLDYRDRVDVETARFIAEQAPTSRPAPKALLDELQGKAIEAALAAVVAAEEAADKARAAYGLVEQAKREGGYAMTPLRDRAAAFGRDAAALLIEAHGRCEAAEGVARAVSLARRGETWTPRDVRADMDALIEAQLARAS